MSKKVIQAAIIKTAKTRIVTHRWCRRILSMTLLPDRVPTRHARQVLFKAEREVRQFRRWLLLTTTFPCSTKIQTIHPPCSRCVTVSTDEKLFATGQQLHSSFKVAQRTIALAANHHATEQQPRSGKEGVRRTALSPLEATAYLSGKLKKNSSLSWQP